MTGSRTEGATPLEDVKTSSTADASLSGRDTSKPHGDKLGNASAAAAAAAVSSEASSGDSPKPHGDKLAHAANEAAKG